MSQTSDIAHRRAAALEAGAADYLQKRADLVDAAARVFRRKGFRAASLQDIAAEVGIERASIYYYTSGKDELFRDVVAAAARENLAMAEALRAGEGRADQKLRDFIMALMASYERHYPYLHVFVQENMAHLDDGSDWDREMRLLGRRFDEAVRGIIQQGLDEGSLAAPNPDARLLANGVIGMCNWSHRWFHPGDEADAATIGAAFAAMVLGGLGVANAG